MDLDRWLDKVGRTPGVTAQQLTEFESSSGVRLPSDYKELLGRSNGAEGAIGSEAYVALWRLEDLIARNQGNGTAEHAPGILLFGSDGGGEAFGFDLREESMPVVNLPFVGMSLDEVKRVAPTITEFLAMLESSAWLPF